MHIKFKNNHLIFVFILIFLVTVYADQGGTDSYGYMWTDSNDPPNIEFAWEDISSEINIFGDSINEDLSGAIPLPFSFSFYGGTPRNQVYISSNGWLSFTYPSGGATYPNNTSIPSGSGPDAMLAVYWDDLVSSTGNNGGVYYKEEGTAPNRRFIVQWHMLNGTPDPDEIEFQVILYETSNLIKFQYNTIDPVFDGGVSATIGIKNNTSQGNQRSNDESGIVSDGTAILFHNSAVTGVSANLSPSSVQIGTFHTFNYTINNIIGPSGLGKLDRIAIGNPLSNIPVVTGVTINGTAVGIQNSSLKPETPGFATWEYVNYPGVDSIIVQTSYFEVINSIIITFMMSIPETTATSYQFGSSSDGILDLSAPVIRTNTSVTLTTGPLQHIVILDDSNGAGDVVNNVTITTDNEITLYAAGYDAGDNFIGDQATAVWTLTGTLDQPGGSGASFTFSPDTAPTSGSINATVGGIFSDATGNITVNVGVLHHIRINGTAGAGGVAVGNTTLTAGQSLNLYASGYDEDGNYRSAVNVTWSSTGTLDPVNASGTSYIFTPTTAPSSGTIVADNGTYSDATGTILVSAGTLSYIKIMPTTGGAGDEVGDVSLSADDALTLYAAGYDANDNYLGDVTATWVSTGTLDDISLTGSSISFNPIIAPASGTIIADVNGESDATGLISVGVGSLHHIKINNSPGSMGVEIGELNLSPGQSINMYATGYDSDNNYVSAINATWGSTGNLDPVSASGTNYVFTPTTASSSGTITITDGIRTDATGTINVGTGAFTNLKILDQPGGAGLEVGDVEMTTDETLTMYAASYDDYDNYLGDQSVTWLSTGNLDAVSATGSSYIFDPVTAPTTGQIIAQSGDISRFTGIINVDFGVLHHILVTSSPGGQAVGSETIISGDSRTFYASGYDEDNNYISQVSAEWSSTGTLDAVSATGPSFTFTPINAPASGTIVATSGTMVDPTGTITVEEGDISYIVIMDAPSGGGSIITSLGLTADESLTAYAASYDASSNYLGDISVIWSTTGTLDFIQTTGTSFTFNPITAPASGTITATSGEFNAATGTISVSVGALSEIKVNDTSGAAGEEINDVSMMTDETLTLYSAGYDADGNFIAMYEAVWSSTGNLDVVSGTGTSYTFDPVTALTSGTIRATYGTFIGETGTITVNQGIADHIRITDGENGAAIGALDLVVNQSITLYASSYDQYDNYISLISANWSTTGSLDNQSNSGTSFTFTPVTAPTSGTIIANSGDMNDDTGIINVDLGSLASIVIRTGPGETGIEFDNYNMTADDSVTLWAAAYDVGGNYLGDTLAVWSRTGNLDLVSGSGVSYNFNPVTAPTSGTIIASAEGQSGQTGTITVTHGTAVSLIDANNLGNQRTTIAGSTQLLRVRVLDQHGNYVSGQTVSFAPAARMSVANATSNTNGIVETYYTTPQNESSSIAEASSSGLDPLFFTVYGIRYVTHSLEPKVVSRGNNIAFTIQVSNPGNVNVPINLSTSHITFSDGQGHSYSASFTFPDVLPANTSNITIQCIAALIDEDFQGGSYTPEIWIVGRDNFSSMNGRLLTDPNELTIGDSDITIGLVQVPDVLQGDDNITANFSVLNTGIPLSIDPFPQTRIEFRQSGTSYPVNNLQRLDTLTVLQTGIPNEFEFQFDIPPNYPVGNIDVFVRLSLDNGNLVVAPTEASGTFQVLSGGNAVYVSNSLNPGNVIPRQSVNFQVDFQNTGLADIVLNPTQTYMEIIDSGIAPINLVGSFSLLNQQTTRISFEEVSIPSNLPIGTYDISWRIYGTMLNGTQIYNDTIDAPGALNVEAPARLVFSNINIPDDIVRQGQSDVEIEYTVTNAGDSDARVSSITPRFRTIDGGTIPSSNWIATSIQPSLPNNISAGSNQTYSVLYTILPNAQTGFIRPAPIINYQDVKTPSFNDTSQTILNNDVVQVIKPAAIRIEELTILDDSIAPNAPYVNVNQPFHLKVTVNNTGADLIQSAKVRLFINSSPIPLDSIIFAYISSGTIQTHEFTRSRSTNGTVTYKVLISDGEALDAIGNPAQIEQPVDNVEDVFVQQPSLLNLNTVIYKSEEFLDSLIVSEGQSFNVRVNIENQGQSPYGNGQIVIRLPEDHFFWSNPQQPDSIKTFTSENSFIEWQIQATQQNNPGIYEIISAEVKQAPTDLNTNNPVQYNLNDNSVHVSVEEIGKITINDLNIFSPSGAFDGTVSTGQDFMLRSKISFNETVSLVGKQAKINLPGDFSVVGGTVRILSADSNTVTEYWLVNAPENVTNWRDISVVASGYDKNSNILIEGTSSSVPIKVVEKARLKLNLQLVKNDGADDDTLSVGQRFKLQAQIDNLGSAATSGSGKIYIEDLGLNPNISADHLFGSFNDTLLFLVGTPVNWNLQVDQLPPEVIMNLLVKLEKAVANEKQSSMKFVNKTYQESVESRKIFNDIYNLTAQSDIRTTELVVKFKGLPDDINTNQEADTATSFEKQTIYIEQKASLNFASIILPDTVSTDQVFTLTVEATPSPNLINPVAMIQLPESFNVPGIIEANMNTQNTAIFNIEVPSDPTILSSKETIQIMIKGTDINSNLPALVSPPESRILNIQIKPKLVMNHEIIMPRSAVTNNMLSYGQTVSINVWADTLPQTSQLKYADITDNGSIVLNQNVFDQSKFIKIENESYEKVFTSYKQKLNFKLRAPQEDITTSVNFNFYQLPKDKFSNALVDVDIEDGSVKIPISVSAKEITVTKIDSLIKNTNFTRGLDGNIIFAFKISNEGYLDNLYVNSLDLLFSAKNDTSRLTDLALANMLETIQVVNYEQYKSAMGKQTLSDPKTYATFAVDGDESRNPIKIDFNQIVTLPPDSVDILMVVAKFAANAVTRSFRTKLTGINAYDDDPDFPVVIVDEQGGHIGESDYFSSDVYNIMTDNLKEAFVVYPNPFVQSEHPRATIKFLLKEQSDVSIRIYTLLGELVRSKWDRNLKGLPPGTYDSEVFWDGRNDRGDKVLNGVYLCTIEIRSGNSTKRFITKIGYIK
jgi:hypothetical protein